MAFILKLNEETKAPVVTEDGKIMYIDDTDNSEIPLDPVGMYTKIGELGKQNKTDRDNYKAIRDKFAPLGDMEDVAEWHKTAVTALATVKNMNDEDWMKADKVDKLKADMKTSYEEKLTAKDTVLSTTVKDHAVVIEGKDKQIRTLMVSNKFASSPYFIGEGKKTILPPDVAESYFGSHFKVKDNDGEPVLRAFHTSGEPIISKVNPGEPADFNEAMGMIIDAYPNKDSILSASGGGGGGKGGTGDDHEDDKDDLTDLKTQHKAALDAGKTQLAISLKNKIFALEQAAKQ